MKLAGLSVFSFINIPYFLKLGNMAGSLLLPAVILWTLFAIALFLLFDKASLVFKTDGTPKAVVWLLVLSAVLAAIAIFIRKSPESLAVDRWSSTKAFWDQFFAGHFPYLGRSHLGNPISGLPFLQVALLPFYFAGEFGLATVFTFLALQVLVYHLTRDYRRVALAALILSGSPAFWFETLTRSDLVFNVALMILAVFCVFRSLDRKTSSRLAACVLVGLALCTRTVLVIPVMVLAASLIRYSWRESLALALAVTVGFALPFALLLPWDLTLLAANNPLTPQLSKGDPWVAQLAMAFAFSLGFGVSDFAGWVGRSLLTFALLFVLLLVLSLLKHGYGQTIDGNMFDISYLNFMLPLLALAAALPPAGNAMWNRATSRPTSISESRFSRVLDSRLEGRVR